MTETKTIPVAIVGGGPVGLMLALFLDYHGVRSVIFNSEPEVRWHPKGSTHNSRTMEHHRRLGLAQTVRGFSLPVDRPTHVSYYTRLTGWELGRIPMPSEMDKRRAVAASAATDQVPEPLLRANQMYVEAFLLEEARRRPNITVRFGWQGDKFEDDADGVTVEAQAIGGGARESWRAQYLIGCDGGRSFVRRSLALRYHGFAKLDSALYGGRMNATYLKAPTLYRDHLAHRPGWQYWTVNPEVRATIISLKSDEEFLVFSKGADDGAPPTDQEMAQMVRRAVGADLPISIIGHWPWTAGVALVAERFIAGRVILAGDAAHLFTPTGGFGMNTGMDDASNLAWKLAAVVQGWGGPRLAANLRDRAPADRRAQHHRSARPQQEPRQHADHRGDGRGHAGRCGSSRPGQRASLDTSARSSPRSACSSARAMTDRRSSPRTARRRPTITCATRRPACPAAGRRISGSAQGRGYGDSLFDRFGRGFTLLRLGDTAADTSSIEAAAQKRGVPLTVLDVPAAEARDLYGTRPRADQARPVCRMARRRTARRCRKI